MSARKLLAVLTVLAATASFGASARADIYEADNFGIEHFSATFSEPLGGSPTLAGSHPDLQVVLDLNQRPGEGGSGQPEETTAGQVQDIEVELPPGLIGNPRAIPTCTMEEIIAKEGFCSPAAQVGVLVYQGFEWPVYNLAASTEQTAVLSVFIFGVPGKIVISPRTDGDYGLTAQLSKISQALPLAQTVLTIWGVPASEVHDPHRFSGFFQPNAKANISVKPFLSLPSRCEPITTEVHADSWQNPGARLPGGAPDLSDPNWKSASDTTEALSGCERLDFRPALKARPTTNLADSPSGLQAELAIPQNTDDPEHPSSAVLRRAEVDLPEGLTINPSAANGLGACSPQQIGLTTPIGAGSPHFTKQPATCPSNSKIGSVEVDTQFFETPLEGSVYTMSPHQIPFGTLLGVYVVIEGRGLVIKLAGRVDADPATGRLTATFDENPQLPFEVLKLSFDGGAFGILRTPSVCGTYSTSSTMVPWSAPATPSVLGTDRWTIAQSPTGDCATTEAQLPKAPTFEAGSTTTSAGAYTPFIFKLSRGDGSQPLGGIDATLPPGLLARLAGTPYCSDSALAAAAQKSGATEQASPSCPAASRVGTVTVGTGAGPRPFYAPGKASLAGPYKGAPLSLAIVTPAVAGPFDLGTVVVRNALFVDPITTQVHAVSDPFPTVLQGIPLDLRSVDLRLQKPDFTRNPTNCEPAGIAGSAAMLAGQSVPVFSHFQASGCESLGFKPTLALSLKGQTNRAGNPALTAVLKAPEGEANIAKTTVILPASQFIDNRHISDPCTRVQFGEGAGNGSACPARSILGTAVAYSPLLEKPLEGPVYFRSNGGERKLPDLVASLGGQIHVNLVGFIDSVRVGKEHSRVRTRFAEVPDAPVSKFVLKLYGGKRGLLQNSTNICKDLGKTTVQMTGQNGKTNDFKTAIRTRCGQRSKGAKRKGRH